MIHKKFPFIIFGYLVLFVGKCRIIQTFSFMCNTCLDLALHDALSLIKRDLKLGHYSLSLYRTCLDLALHDALSPY